MNAELRAPTDPLLDRVVRSIVEAVDPEEIVLFGSMAAGTAGAESDIDLIVIEREPFGPGRSRRHEWLRIATALSGVPCPVDVLVYSRAEADRWRTSLNHILARALREGKVVYARR